MVDRSVRFYAALGASTVSSVAWLATGVGALAVLYSIVTSNAVAGYGTVELVGGTVGALLVGAVFAQVEKRLYRIREE